MRLIKKCFAAGLTALMLSMTVAASLPTAGITAQASNTYSSLNWYGLTGKSERTLDEDKTIGSNYKMTVELGEAFTIGDFATGSFSGRLSDSASVSKAATYKSTKKSVATVSKTGVVTPKKKGSTVLSIKFDDETINLTLKVVSKKYSNKEDVTAIQDDIAALLKKYPKESSITVKNSITVAKKIAAINKKLRTFYVENNKIDSYGFYCTDYYKVATTDYNNRLVVVNLAQYRDLVETFTDLQQEKSAFDTRKAGFSIKSASAKFNAKTVTVKFSKKVSATQIFSLISLSDYNQTFKSSMKVEVAAVIVKVDADGNEELYDAAYGTIKKGSKSVKLTLNDQLLEKGNYKVYLTNNSSVYSDNYYSNNVLLKTITPCATYTVQ
ncbi:MAG: hypothetical protein ACERKZ_17290 [Lachnotalea sp.]